MKFRNTQDESFMFASGDRFIKFSQGFYTTDSSKEIEDLKKTQHYQWGFLKEVDIEENKEDISPSPIIISTEKDNVDILDGIDSQDYDSKSLEELKGLFELEFGIKPNWNVKKETLIEKLKSL